MLHLDRANYVAKIWKSTGIAMIDLPSPTQHGRTEDWDILWTDEMFPESMTDYVVSNEDYDEDYFEDDIEGDVFDESDEEDAYDSSDDEENNE